MVQRFLAVKGWLEYLEGATDVPPASCPRVFRSGLFWGAWWAFLVLVMLAFSGQTSQFIYIDF